VDEGNLDYLMKNLGCRKIRRSGSNLICTCPFGEFGGHSKGDRHPSFSISTGNPSKWKCWGANCRRTGYSARSLLYQLKEAGGIATADSMSDFVNENEQKNTERQRHNKLDSWDRQNRQYKGRTGGGWEVDYEGVFDLKDYEQDLARLPQYAVDRGIDVGQARKYGIGYKETNKVKRPDGSEKSYEFHRLFFATFNHEDKFVGWSGRAIPGFTPSFGEDEPSKYYHAPGFKKEKYLYGEQHIDFKNPTAILVEGFMDVLNLDRLGLKNSLAILGGSVSDYQIAKLKKWFKRVIIFPHNDDPDDRGRCAGLEMANDAKEKLHQVDIQAIIAPLPKNSRQFCDEFRPPCDPGEYIREDLDWIFEMIRRQFLNVSIKQGQEKSEEGTEKKGSDSEESG